MTKDNDVHGCDENGFPLDPMHPWNREGVPEDQCPVCAARDCSSSYDPDFHVQVYQCKLCGMIWPGRRDDAR